MAWMGLLLKDRISHAHDCSELSIWRRHCVYHFWRQRRYDNFWASNAGLRVVHVFHHRSGVGCAHNHGKDFWMIRLPQVWCGTKSLFGFNNKSWCTTRAFPVEYTLQNLKAPLWLAICLIWFSAVIKLDLPSPGTPSWSHRPNLPCQDRYFRGTKKGVSPRILWNFVVR